MELQKKAEGERGELGTGRITQTRRRVADPKKVAQEKVVYNNFSDVHKTQRNYASSLTLNYYK